MDDLITPEGQAFSDYIDGVENNPYTEDTMEHGLYNAAIRELLNAHQEAEG